MKGWIAMDNKPKMTTSEANSATFHIVMSMVFIAACASFIWIMVWVKPKNSRRSTAGNRAPHRHHANEIMPPPSGNTPRPGRSIDRLAGVFFLFKFQFAILYFQSYQ